MKSPRERDAHWSFQTEYNLNGLSRREVLEMIKKSGAYKMGAGFCRLYSFTLSSQLYDYYRRSDQHIEAFQRLQIKDITMGADKIIPYLSVPVENMKIVKRVLLLLRENDFIAGYRSRRVGGLLIISIKYGK